MSPPLDEKWSFSFLSSIKVFGSPLMQRRDDDIGLDSIVFFLSMKLNRDSVGSMVQPPSSAARPLSPEQRIVSEFG